MKLYFSPGACSLSPHIALREAGLDFTLQKVDTKTKTLDGGGDYWALNGKGYVPMLEMQDGERLTEGPAIVQYIADLKPVARAKLSKRLDWVAQQLEGKTYLTGDAFTIADAYLFVVLNWTKHVGIDLATWPTLTAYQARVAARPKVQEALR